MATGGLAHLGKVVLGLDPTKAIAIKKKVPVVESIKEEPGSESSLEQEENLVDEQEKGDEESLIGESIKLMQVQAGASGLARRNRHRGSRGRSGSRSHGTASDAKSVVEHLRLYAAGLALLAKSDAISNADVRAVT